MQAIVAAFALQGTGVALKVDELNVDEIITIVAE